MLTKEQCLSEELNPQSSAIDLSNPHLRDAVFYGMQLYAKEVALYFAAYTALYIKNDKMGIMETEQLFELFLQSINQNG